MALSTIPHGRIALRPGTKSLEHSPSSVASIHRTASQGRMRRQSTKRRGARDELPGVGRLSVRHPTRGEAGKERVGRRAALFGSRVMSLPHTAPWDLTNAAKRVKYTLVEML